MPTYSYECKKCAHVREVYHGMSADPRVTCTECGGAMTRLIGTGAGIIFKGSGFYETDYKKSSASKSSNGASKSESKSESSGESKSSAKSDSSSKK
jgi:putative FmdB family regulatory protein